MLSTRKSRPDDFAVLQQLAVESIRSIDDNQYSQGQLNAWALALLSGERLRLALKQQIVIVASLDAAIVGFASLSKFQEVDFMYVGSNNRFSGIGSILLEKIILEANKFGYEFLTANVSKPAYKFFTGKGFVKMCNRNQCLNGVEIENYAMYKSLK
jgi:GNAT superfamily N-acetyltransferase